MENAPGTINSSGQTQSVPGELPLSFEDYRTDFEELQISAEKSEELFGILCHIMRMLVECGYSFDVSGRATLEIFNHIAGVPPKDEA